MGIINSDQDFSIEEVQKPLEIVPEFETGFQLLQKHNPSIKGQKQYQIVAAELGEKIAKGSRMPVVSLSASALGSSDNIADAISNNFGDKQRTNASLSISIPLYTGSSISTRIQKQKLLLTSRNQNILLS